jgi:S1-C subfamily serine protease
LIKHGKVIRPGLGVGIMDEMARERYIGDKGAAITFIDEDGSAYKAGLRGMRKDRYGRIFPGDVILRIAGKEVNNRDDVYLSLDKFNIGDKVEIEYLRDDKKKKTKVTLRALEN